MFYWLHVSTIMKGTPSFKLNTAKFVLQLVSLNRKAEPRIYYIPEGNSLDMKKILMGLWIIIIQTFILIPSANATCMESCSVSLSNQECGLKTTFETDEYLYISGTCSVHCCTPPSDFNDHGRCSSSQSSLGNDDLSISNVNDQTRRVTFFKTEYFCNEQPLFRINQRLHEGRYLITSQGFFINEFNVVKDTDRSTKIIGLAVIILLAIVGL